MRRHVLILSSDGGDLQAAGRGQHPVPRGPSDQLRWPLTRPPLPGVRTYEEAGEDPR
jgi:hypothetical protein